MNEIRKMNLLLCQKKSGIFMEVEDNLK